MNGPPGTITLTHVSHPNFDIARINGDVVHRVLLNEITIRIAVTKYNDALEAVSKQISPDSILVMCAQNWTTGYGKNIVKKIIELYKVDKVISLRDALPEGSDDLAAECIHSVKVSRMQNQAGMQLYECLGRPSIIRSPLNYSVKTPDIQILIPSNIELTKQDIPYVLCNCIVAFCKVEKVGINKVGNYNVTCKSEQPIQVYGFGFITECNEECVYYTGEEDIMTKDSQINGMILLDSQLQSFLMTHISTISGSAKIKKLASNLCGFSFGITHRCPVGNE